MNNIFLVLVLILTLTIPSFAAYETGPADTVLRVPSAGGKPAFGSTLKKISISGATLGAVAKSADYTLTATDDVIRVDASGAQRTMTLPTAVGISGKIYTVIKTDSSANFVVLDANSTETINGQLVYNLVQQYGLVAIQSDGTNWVIINERNRWFVNATISGSGFILSTGDVASFSTGVIEDASETLTNLSGALTAQIPCSGTNPPTGTTCAAGSESAGVAVAIPNQGWIRVCAHFVYYIDGASGSPLSTQATFIIVQTANNSQTHVTEGNQSTLLGATAIGTDDNRSTWPGHVCEDFNVSTTAQIAFRLRYRQSAGITSSGVQVLTGSSTILPFATVDFTVTPLGNNN